MPTMPTTKRDACDACDDAQPAKRPCFDCFSSWNEPYTMVKGLPLLSIPEDIFEAMALPQTPRNSPATSPMRRA